jgi:hypothetical protein
MNGVNAEKGRSPGAHVWRREDRANLHLGRTEWIVEAGAS